MSRGRGIPGVTLYLMQSQSEPRWSGFIHNGSERSFALDIADTIKMHTTVELAFKVVAESGQDLETRTRHACRDMFKEQQIPKRLVTIINEVLA